jgi:hypothetical protein
VVTGCHVLFDPGTPRRLRISQTGTQNVDRPKIYDAVTSSALPLKRYMAYRVDPIIRCGSRSANQILGNIPHLAAQSVALVATDHSCRLCISISNDLGFCLRKWSSWHDCRAGQVRQYQSKRTVLLHSLTNRCRRWLHTRSTCMMIR